MARANIRLQRMSDSMPSIISGDSDYRIEWQETAKKVDAELERMEVSVSRYFGGRFPDRAYDRLERAADRLDAIALEYPAALGPVMAAYERLGSCRGPLDRDSHGDIDFSVATFGVERGARLLRDMASPYVAVGESKTPRFRDLSSEWGVSPVSDIHGIVSDGFQNRMFDGQGRLSDDKHPVSSIDLSVVDDAVAVVAGGYDDSDSEAYGSAYGYLAAVRRSGDPVAVNRIMEQGASSGWLDAEPREASMLERGWRKVMLEAAMATVPGKGTPDKSIRAVAYEKAGLEYDDASDTLHVHEDKASGWLVDSLRDDPPAAFRGDGFDDMRIVIEEGGSTEAPYAPGPPAAGDAGLRSISVPPIVPWEYADDIRPCAVSDFEDAMRILAENGELDNGYDGRTGIQSGVYASALHTIDSLASDHIGLEEMAGTVFGRGSWNGGYDAAIAAARHGYVDQGLFDATLTSLMDGSADHSSVYERDGSIKEYLSAAVSGNVDAAVRFAEIVGDRDNELTDANIYALGGSPSAPNSDESLARCVHDALSIAGEHEALEEWENGGLQRLKGVWSEVWERSLQEMRERHGSPAAERVPDAPSVADMVMPVHDKMVEPAVNEDDHHRGWGWQATMLRSALSRNGGFGAVLEHDGPAGDVVTDTGAVRMCVEDKLAAMDPVRREALDQLARAFLTGMAAVSRGETVSMTMVGGDPSASAPELGEDDREMAKGVIDGLEL